MVSFINSASSSEIKEPSYFFMKILSKVSPSVVTDADGKALCPVVTIDLRNGFIEYLSGSTSSVFRRNEIAPAFPSHFCSKRQ